MRTSKTSIPDLDRVVTICAGKETRYSQSTSRLGLVFCDRTRDLTRTEQINIMLDKEVREIFGDYFYGMLITFEPAKYYYHNSVHKARDFPQAFYVVAGGEGLFAIGDEVPFFIMQGDKFFETTRKELFMRCALMQKWIGCNTCSWQGDRCTFTFRKEDPVTDAPPLTAQLPFAFMHGRPSWDDSFLERIQYLDFEDWKERQVRTWRDTLAGFTYVPPAAGHGNPLQPGLNAIQAPFQVNFSGVEDVQGMFSDRSAAGRKTALFKIRECSQCYFGGTVRRYNSEKTRPTSCNQYAPRHCNHGAWTEERLHAYTMELATKAIKTRSPFSMEEVWRIARVAGIPFQVKDPRTGCKREWQVGRLVDSGERISIQLTRTSMSSDARGDHRNVHSLEELRTFVPDFLWEHFQQTEPPINEDQFALWLQLTSARHGRSYSFFYSTKKHCGYGNYTPSIHSVRLDTYGSVEYETVMSRQRRKVRLRTFSDMYHHFGNLLLFGIHDREPVQNPKFDTWVR